MDVLNEYFVYKLTLGGVLSTCIYIVSLFYFFIFIKKKSFSAIIPAIIMVLCIIFLYISYETKQMIQVVLYDDYIIDAEKFIIHKIEHKLYTLEVK